MNNSQSPSFAFHGQYVSHLHSDSTKILTAELIEEADLWIQIIRLYELDENGLKPLEIRLPASTKDKEIFLMPENYLLSEYGNNRVVIYVRGPKSIFRLEPNEKDSQLEIKRSIAYEQHPSANFGMAFNHETEQLVYYPRQIKKQNFTTKIYFEGTENFIDIAGTEFESTQWKLTTLQALQIEGSMKILAIFQSVAVDSSKLAFFDEEKLLCAEKIGIWNNRIGVNLKSRIIHTYEEEGTNVVQNSFFEIHGDFLERISDASNSIHSCTSHPQIGNRNSIIVVDNCELASFNYESKTLSKLGVKNKHKTLRDYDISKMTTIENEGNIDNQKFFLIQYKNSDRFFGGTKETTSIVMIPESHMHEPIYYESTLKSNQEIIGIRHSNREFIYRQNNLMSYVRFYDPQSKEEEKQDQQSQQEREQREKNQRKQRMQRQMMERERIERERIERERIEKERIERQKKQKEENQKQKEKQNGNKEEEREEIQPDQFPFAFLFIFVLILTFRFLLPKFLLTIRNKQIPDRSTMGVEQPQLNQEKERKMNLKET